MKRIVLGISILVFAVAITIFFSNEAYPADYSYSIVNLEKVSRYYEDRIVFQHIEDNSDIMNDNSISCLLIIDRGHMYQVIDGYDDPRGILQQALHYKLANRNAPDLWKNKVNSSPDFIRITERRMERVLNTSEDFVTRNFGVFYKSIRNAFLEKHVKVFKSLILNRAESKLVVNSTEIIPADLFSEQKKESKFIIRVSAKTIDDTTYFAEDLDGDGITETFMVNIADGFTWGYKSGANLIFIYKNKSEDIKQIIGNLTRDAYRGTPEEEKVITSNFPPDTDIIKEHRLDEDPLVKIQKEKLTQKGSSGR